MLSIDIMKHYNVMWTFCPISVIILWPFHTFEIEHEKIKILDRIHKFYYTQNTVPLLIINILVFILNDNTCIILIFQLLCYYSLKFEFIMS